MKRLILICLTFSVFLNVCFVLFVFNQMAVNRKVVKTVEPFSITNINNSTTNPDYVVAYQGGRYWWNIDGEVLSMNVGLKQGAILRLDNSTGRVKSTTIELLDTNGDDCYFTDMNADGVPDKVRVGGRDDWQVFYNGAFIPSFLTNNVRYIVISNVEHQIKFGDGRWIAE